MMASTLLQLQQQFNNRSTAAENGSVQNSPSETTTEGSHPSPGQNDDKSTDNSQQAVLSNDQPQDLTAKGQQKNASYTCSKCDKRGESVAMLQMHMRDAHGIELPMHTFHNSDNHLLINGGATDASNLIGIDYASLLTTGALNPDGSLPPVSEDGKRKIFNPEAYCDLCQKEFCSKYYLSTHRATKHGIGQVTNQHHTGGFFGSIGSDGSNMISDNLLATMAQFAQKTSVASSNSSPLMPNLGQEFPNNNNTGPGPGLLNALNPGFIQALLNQRRQQQDQSESNEMQGTQLPSLIPSVSQAGGTQQQSDQPLTCTLCGSRCQNMFGLQVHMLTIHGPAGRMILQQQTGAQSTDHFSQQQTTNQQLDTSPTLPGQEQTAPYPPTSAFGGSLLDPTKMMALLNQHQPASTPNLTSYSPDEGLVPEGTGNKEAYCDICQKEFCSKYFFKIHKQKKHGIEATDSTPGSARKRSSTEIDGFDASQGIIPSTIMSASPVKPFESPIGHQRLGDTNNNANNHIASSSPPHKLPKLEESGSTTPSNRTFSLDNMIGQLTSNAAAAAAFPGNVNNSLNCSLCPRTFPSVFALMLHKTRDHVGVDHVQRNIPTTLTPQKDSLVNGTDAAVATNEELFCEICKKEFVSKYFLISHKQNVHGLQFDEAVAQSGHTGNIQPKLTPPSSTSSGLDTARIMAQIQAMQSNIPSMVSRPGLSTNFGSSPSFNTGQRSVPAQAPAAPAPRQYASGKNFCDICNKEVCNKYFLRTHMLKMHGIVIDENKAIIGNINTIEKEKTGGLVFRCDICSSEVPSRYALKVHKQSVHGVSPGPDPPQTTPSKSTPHQSAVSMSAHATSLHMPSLPALAAATNQENSSVMASTSQCVTNGVMGASIQCPLCTAQQTSSTDLAKHLRSAHSNAVSEQLIQAYEQLVDAGTKSASTPSQYAPQIEPEIPQPVRAEVGKNKPADIGSKTPLIVERDGAKHYRCSYCIFMMIGSMSAIVRSARDCIDCR